MKSMGVLSLLSCCSLMFACAGANSRAEPATAAIAQADAAGPVRGAEPAQSSANEPCALTPAADAPVESAGAARGESEPPATAPASAAASDISTPRAAESSRNHRGKVKELFGLMEMQKIIDATLEDTISTQIKANPALAQFKDVMLEFLAKHMSWKSLEPGFIEDYMETFSQAEIEDMIAFYKTPTGAKAIAALPALMKRGARRGLESVEKHMPELQKIIEERLESQ